MESFFLLPSIVKVGGNTFKHNDVIFGHDIDNPAFDICEALLDYWCPNMFGFQTGEFEFCKLISISSGACSHSNNGINEVNRWD